MQVALPNIYCSFTDLADYMSSEGVELRLDDHNQSTGQQVQVTANANQGDTSLTIAALENNAPLPNGCVLNFDGAGLAAVVQVVLTKAAPAGATSLTVLPLTAAIPQNAYAFDNGVNIATNARVLKAAQYATSRIKLYCCSRYNDSDLATAWSVNRWAMVLAARWLAKRRMQGCPAGIEDDYKETMEELKAVKARQLDIEDIATRTSSWPAFSNVSIDLTYDTHRVRVEPSMSEMTPTQYGQYRDWNDQQGMEW